MKEETQYIHMKAIEVTSKIVDIKGLNLPSMVCEAIEKEIEVALTEAYTMGVEEGRIEGAKMVTDRFDVKLKDTNT